MTSGLLLILNLSDVMQALSAQMTAAFSAIAGEGEDHTSNRSHLRLQCFAASEGLLRDEPRDIGVDSLASDKISR